MFVCNNDKTDQISLCDKQTTNKQTNKTTRTQNNKCSFGLGVCFVTIANNISTFDNNKSGNSTRNLCDKTNQFKCVVPDN